VSILRGGRLQRKACDKVLSEKGMMSEFHLRICGLHLMDIRALETNWDINCYVFSTLGTSVSGDIRKKSRLKKRGFEIMYSVI
jgi:hypothetical protein